MLAVEILMRNKNKFLGHIEQVLLPKLRKQDLDISPQVQSKRKEL